MKAIDARGPTRLHRMAVALAAIALVASACGGGDDADDIFDDAPSTTPAPATTQAGGGGGTETPADEDPQPVSFTVGEEVWHSGFRINVVGGELTPDVDSFTREVDWTLTINLDVENLNTDDAFFGPWAVVVANTGSYSWDSGFSQAGDIPGLLTGKAEIRLRVDEGFDPASATLIFGRADENQAVAPMGPGGDAAVRLEPETVDVSGAIEMELIDMVFEGGALTYDRVERNEQVESGKRALRLDFDVVSRRSGNWSVFPNDFALIVPDGTAIAPVPSNIPNIPGSDDGVTTGDISITFIVDADATGDYTLRFTAGSWFVGDDDVDQGTFEFTLP